MKEISLWLAGVAFAVAFQGVSFALQGWILKTPRISPEKATKIQTYGKRLAIIGAIIFLIGLLGFIIL